MRISVVGLVIFCSGLSYGTELPRFFDSGSNFSGTISRHKLQGDPRVEARISRVGERITLRMLTLAGRAVVLVARRVGTETTVIDTFQANNNEGLFTGARTLLEEKARQLDGAVRQNDPFIRTDIFQAREYTNRDLTVALPVQQDPRARASTATIVMSAATNDNVQGEFIVSDPNNVIVENVWFDVRRDAQPAAVPAAPAPVPAPAPAPAPVPAAAPVVPQTRIPLP